MKLHDLKPQEGSKQNRKRVGRGIAAGQGRTCGRGQKGQGARAGGGTRLYHQGGNLPFYRRLPFKRGEGFTPVNQVEYNEVNLDQLSVFSAGSEVTPESMAEGESLTRSTQPGGRFGARNCQNSLESPCPSHQRQRQSQN